MSLGDLLTIGGFLLTFAGLVFAGWQFRQNARVERARFLVEMANRLLAENEVEAVFYAILEGGFQFNPQHPPGQAQQRALDSLLSQFNLIGRLLQMKIINGEDATFFRAESWVVLTNAQVNVYIAWANEQPGTPPGGWWPYLPPLVQHLAPQPAGRPQDAAPH